MKNKEKDLLSFREELGVINIIDVDKVLRMDKKFSPLSILKTDELNYLTAGMPESKIQENDEIKEKTEKKEKTASKKKKKKAKEEKKDGDTKICKKDKK